MGSFSGLGIGLSFVFGCILMGLVAELYYLLWWKKRISSSFNSNTNTNTNPNPEKIEDSCFVFSWKKHNPQEEQVVDLEMMGSTKDNLGLKGCYGEEEEEEDEEGIEAEIMRLHNLCGPPRFLFTINEESKEDLESEDGKSRRSMSSRKGSRTKSLSDFLLSSPTLKPDSYNNNHNNLLLFEEAEGKSNRLMMRSSSPPPNFKFMKDAEDKLIRKLLQAEADEEGKRGLTVTVEEDSQQGKKNDVCFVRFAAAQPQVLPLPSSPTDPLCTVDRS